MIKYKVVFTSKTGNTEKLAKAVYEAIGDSSKDIERISEQTGTDDAQVYLIGFWVDRGSCSLEIMDFLDELDEKQIILFGTCGSDPDAEYCRRIETNIQAFIPDGNEYLGLYLSQGKMPMKIRKKYEDMKDTEDMGEHAERMISNFDRALLHPDARDLEGVKQFIREILEKREGRR